MLSAPENQRSTPSSSRCCSTRRSPSGSGRGSLTTPVSAIFFSIWYIFEIGSQVHAAVAQIERLIDEREVWNDVADHGMLEQRPVLPRRIMCVDARQRTA